MPETASSASSSLRQDRQTIAVFMPKTDENGRVLSDDLQRQNRVTVHFNPESLDITFTNSIQQGRRNQPAQVSVTESSARLGMELLFDTTLTGLDVRVETNKIARLMDPAQQTPRRNNRDGKIPSIVIFQWGTIWFEGYIDSYREKIDFFSSEGVPLRATVTLSMTQQERNFEPSANAAMGSNPGAGGLSLDGNSPINRLGSMNSVTDAIKRLNPSAGGISGVARALAAANGIENIRLPEVKELVVPSLQLSQNPRIGFSVGGSVDNAGLQTSGRTEALFADLKKSAGMSSPGGLSLDLESHFNVNLGMGVGISGLPGGSLDGGGGASMSADVGLSADIELGIKFEE
jgi:hypothetical protein